MDARVFIIEFFGEHSGKLGWKCELLMSDSDNDRGAVACSYVNSVFTASSTRSAIRGLNFSAVCSSDALAWTCDGLSWLHNEFESRTNGLSYPVFAASYEAQPVTVLVCGCESAENLLDLCKPDAAFEALEKQRHIGGVCAAV